MNGTCKLCNIDKEIVKHHIDYENNKTVPLCKSCHLKIHSDINHPLYPVNGKGDSNSKTVQMNFRLPPNLLKNLQTIDPNRSTTLLVRKSIEFYIKYHNTNVDKEQRFDTLLNKYIELVNKLIENPVVR